MIPKIIYNLFKDYGITKDWLYALTYGSTYVFNDNTVVSILHGEDRVFINSAGEFPLKSLLFISKTIEKNRDKTIYIQTTSNKAIKRLSKRYGAKFDNNLSCCIISSRS